MGVVRLKKSQLRAMAIKQGFRSGLEDSIAEQLKAAGVSYKYEELKIEYTKPAKKCKYSPDFVLPNGIIVETKGRFVLEDRQKHVLIKEQHPELDIRFVFQTSSQKIRKGSKTSYADWCIKYGFKYADKQIPEEWMKE